MSFGISSIEHGFAVALHDLKLGLGFVQKEEPVINAVEADVAPFIPLAGPTALVASRAAEAVLGKVLASASSLNITDPTQAPASLTISVEAADVMQLVALARSLASHPAVQAGAAATAAAAKK